MSDASIIYTFLTFAFLIGGAILGTILIFGATLLGIGVGLVMKVIGRI